MKLIYCGVVVVVGISRLFLFLWFLLFMRMIGCLVWSLVRRLGMVERVMELFIVGFLLDLWCLW